MAVAEDEDEIKDNNDEEDEMKNDEQGKKYREGLKCF